MCLKDENIIWAFIVFFLNQAQLTAAVDICINYGLTFSELSDLDMLCPQILNV